MVLHKMTSEFLIWRLGEHRLFPEVRGEITVGLGNGIKSGLGKAAPDGSDGRMEMQQWSIQPSPVASWAQGLR